MNIQTVDRVPDSTYFRTGDVEPTVVNDTINMIEGQGSRRSWGRPQANNTVLIDDCDFVVIHTGFSHKHGGGQFFMYEENAERPNRTGNTHR